MFQIYVCLFVYLFVCLFVCLFVSTYVVVMVVKMVVMDTVSVGSPWEEMMHHLALKEKERKNDVNKFQDVHLHKEDVCEFESCKKNNNN